jgi:integrase
MPRVQAPRKKAKARLCASNTILGLARIGPHERHPAVAQPKMRHLDGDRRAVDQHDLVARRRTAKAGFRNHLGCHVFRATGITACLERGGTLENAQVMTAHESPRTTKLYDRTGDQITLDEVEKIQI